MTIEYLIAINKGNTLCSDKESLKRYISVSREISINKDKLTFKGHSLKFTIREKLKADKNHHYFEFCLDFDLSIPDDVIIDLVRLLKSNFLKIDHKNVNLKILWDDLGIQYNIKAYPVINKIENLLRKLISKFMILNVGIDWFSSSTTKDTQQKSRERGSDDIFFDNVYQLDFIDLSEVLFGAYRTMSIQDVDNMIKTLDDSALLSQIKDFYPRSNWERYFSSIVNYDEKKIKTIWTELYGIRNSIAHNRFISKSNLDRLYEIGDELEPILKEAIVALDKISLSEEEKEAIKFNQKEERAVRLIVASKKLKKDMSTLVDFLATKGKSIRLNANTKVYPEDYRLLVQEFGDAEMLYNLDNYEKQSQILQTIINSNDSQRLLFTEEYMNDLFNNANKMKSLNSLRTLREISSKLESLNPLRNPLSFSNEEDE